TWTSVMGGRLRTVVARAPALGTRHGQPGWRQHRHLLKQVKKIVRDIDRAARAKRKGADHLKPGYQRLLDLAEGLMERARQLLQALAFRVEAAPDDGRGARACGSAPAFRLYRPWTQAGACSAAGRGPSGRRARGEGHCP